MHAQALTPAQRAQAAGARGAAVRGRVLQHRKGHRLHGRSASGPHQSLPRPAPAPVRLPSQARRVVRVRRGGHDRRGPLRHRGRTDPVAHGLRRERRGAVLRGRPQHHGQSGELPFRPAGPPAGHHGVGRACPHEPRGARRGEAPDRAGRAGNVRARARGVRRQAQARQRGAAGRRRPPRAALGHVQRRHVHQRRAVPRARPGRWPCGRLSHHGLLPRPPDRRAQVRVAGAHPRRLQRVRGHTRVPLPAGPDLPPLVLAQGRHAPHQSRRDHLDHGQGRARGPALLRLDPWLHRADPGVAALRGNIHHGAQEPEDGRQLPHEPRSERPPAGYPNPRGRRGGHRRRERPRRAHEERGRGGSVRAGHPGRGPLRPGPGASAQYLPHGCGQGLAALVLHRPVLRRTGPGQHALAHAAGLGPSVRARAPKRERHRCRPGRDLGRDSAGPGRSGSACDHEHPGLRPSAAHCASRTQRALCGGAFT